MAPDPTPGSPGFRNSGVGRGPSSLRNFWARPRSPTLAGLSSPSSSSIRTGSGGRTDAVGWIGRYADLAFKDNSDAQPTIAIGSTGSRFWLMEARQRTPLNISDPAAFGAIAEQAKAALA